MTDNLPAVRPSNEVATADTDSWIQVMGPLVKLAESVASTEFVPKQLRGKPAAVTAALLYGREVGLPPMTALTMTHVIEGKPAMSAEGMRALVLAAGHDIETLESTGGMCRMRGRRRGSETWTPVEWSIDSARAAGLLAKDNWKNYPRQMLQARTTAELCRLVFPDVIHGFRATEELDDILEEAPSAPAAPASMTTVKRTARTAKKAPAAAALPAAETKQRPPAPEGVPLPGEDGYDDVVPGGEAVPPTPAASPSPTAPESVTPTDSGAPEQPNEDPPAADVEPATEAVEDKSKSNWATRPQLTRIRLTLNGFGMVGEQTREARLTLVGRIVGREIDSTTHLTVDEASAVIDTLARVRSIADLEALLDANEA